MTFFASVVLGTGMSLMAKEIDGAVFALGFVLVPDYFYHCCACRGIWMLVYEEMVNVMRMVTDCDVLLASVKRTSILKEILKETWSVTRMASFAHPVYYDLGVHTCRTPF